MPDADDNRAVVFQIVDDHMRFVGENTSGRTDVVTMPPYLREGGYARERLSKGCRIRVCLSEAEQFGALRVDGAQIGAGGQ